MARAGSGNGSEGGQNQNNGPPAHTEFAAREYVHSPGYVDEFVCEIDTGGTTDTFWWVLQDPNYNVVALVSDGAGSLSRGEVARQYSWSPYGELLRADIYDTSAPMSRLGHQGLFHDRLDADILSEPMVAFSDQVVQNRNRTLSPRLGRFLQGDPNASALGVLNSLVCHGESLAMVNMEVDGDELFGDGMNLYGYLRSSPPSGVDPSGLSFVSTGVQLLVSNLLTRPIVLTSGRVALNLADDVFMGYSGFSMGGGLIGGGTIVGAGLLDDLLGGLPRFFVSDWAAATARNFSSWAHQFANPRAGRSVPSSFVPEVISEARRLGFTNIRHEVGGARSGSWQGLWHINMSKPDGGRVLHILTETP